MKTVKIVVSGRVTGVGFRFSAVNEARHHSDLRGWVRNRDSRTVEAMVQGDAAAVDALTEWFRHGPTGARVKACLVDEINTESRLAPFQVTQ